MSVDDLYRQRVLDHHHHPRNFGNLSDATHAADGLNPLCGDRVRFEARCEQGRIVDVRFTGESCAIATASASMLTTLVAGFDAASVDALRTRFAAWLVEKHDGDLGELESLAELRRYPARHKCALLPFETLAAALAERASASTESAHE